MYENKNYNRKSRVETGSEHTVKIEDTGRSGDGVAKIDGFIVFVPDTKVGQEVKIKLKDVRRNFGFAELIK